jgi:hypothetical protein
MDQIGLGFGLFADKSALLVSMWSSPMASEFCPGIVKLNFLKIRCHISDFLFFLVPPTPPTHFGRIFLNFEKYGGITRV